MTTSIYDEIAAKRQKQITKGYDAGHDDRHVGGQIAKAAAAYALSGFKTFGIWTGRSIFCQGKSDPEVLAISPKSLWPWGDGFNPGAGREALVDAAALLVAEIERLDRIPHPQTETTITIGG